MNVMITNPLVCLVQNLFLKKRGQKKSLVEFTTVGCSRDSVILFWYYQVSINFKLKPELTLCYRSGIHMPFDEYTAHTWLVYTN